MVEYRRYNYPRRKPRGDKPLNHSLVPYVACVGTPLTLIGVSIKHILSDKEYGDLAKSCKIKAKNNCELCGRWVSRTRDDFIHVQELYDKDLDGGVFRYKGLVGLCKECFYIFNPYILDLELKNFVINSKYVDRIRRNRLIMLSTFGFDPIELPKNKVFILEYRGYRYINDSIPSILGRALESGVRVLPMRKNYMAIHPDLYYHKPPL